MTDERQPVPVPTITPAPSTGVIATIKAHPTNYLALSRHPSQIQAVVIHSTEGHEGLTAAEDLGRMFAGLLTPKRSCHYGVDTDSIVSYVPELQIAYHCGHAGNHRTVGFELCGTAKQSPAEWLDARSRPMLALAARLTAELCQRYQMPVRLLDADALRAGERGITTHAAVGQAWRESAHTDPGPNFPMADFIHAVDLASAALKLGLSAR